MSFVRIFFNRLCELWVGREEGLRAPEKGKKSKSVHSRFREAFQVRLSTINELHCHDCLLAASNHVLTLSSKRDHFNSIDQAFLQL